ncbi:hypothetical protein NPS01_24150 [Nocardioides psychrotolerans]|uniref:Uncharacterized protein n=1 Tax=Nocardioides psychrotolerans TaxID=1005945 RepID=A0A1I3LBK3_9ACTN|nr:hypothetical protein [Nocardioides psychrotolerans]GEP38752.1 hypothetical protein NPS01_24150 [Nocardioides psychrotolerans]SFI81940.1 hypothetical protein SAMN05216561_11389 [Nocardioides psychrotolerans]
MRSSGRLQGVARRIAAGTGLEEVLRLRRRVESLEVAVAENSALAEPLEAQVAALEQSLVVALEHRVRQVRKRF